MCICDHGTVPLTVPHVHTTASGRALRRPRQDTALRRAVLTGPWRAHDVSQRCLQFGSSDSGAPRQRLSPSCSQGRGKRTHSRSSEMTRQSDRCIPQRVYDTISTQYTQLLHGNSIHAHGHMAQGSKRVRRPISGRRVSPESKTALSRCWCGMHTTQPASAG